MTNTNTGFTEQQWQTRCANINIAESEAVVLVLANLSADLFRAKIVSGNTRSTEIFRSYLPSLERLSWLYSGPLADGPHDIGVGDLTQFQYVDASGQSYFASDVGRVFVNVVNHPDDTITHTGLLLNVRCERQGVEVTVNGTFTYQGPGT